MIDKLVAQFVAQLKPSTAQEFPPITISSPTEDPGAQLLIAHMSILDELPPDEIVVANEKYVVGSSRQETPNAYNNYTHKNPYEFVHVTDLTNTRRVSTQNNHIVIGQDRAEVQLRQAIRRANREGVSLERIAEIFNLEQVCVVHDS
jgi:hypothetical protein